VKSISENELNSLWRDFGKNMNLVAIMIVLTLVTGITGIIAFKNFRKCWINNRKKTRIFYDVLY